MKIYNTFMLTRDKDGGYISDTIDAGEYKDMPDLSDFIRSLGSYKFRFDPKRTDTDRLIMVQVYDDAVPGPSKFVCQRWFSEVYFKDHSEEYVSREAKRGLV